MRPWPKLLANTLLFLNYFLAVLSTTLICIHTFRSKSIAARYLVESTYGIMSLFLLSIIVILLCGLWSVRQKILPLIKEHYRYLAVIALLVGFIFIAIEPQFRIQNDAAKRASTALSFWHDHSFKIIQTGTWQDGKILPSAEIIPGRPPLFTYLTSLIHTIRGYNLNNIFILNFFSSLLFMMSIYAFSGLIMDRMSSISAVLLSASHYVITLYCASDDYGILTCGFQYFSIYLGYLYAINPCRNKLNLLLISAVALGILRPETIVLGIYIIVFITLLSAHKAYRFQSYFHPWVFFFLLPTFWQRFIKGLRHGGENISSLQVSEQHGMYFLILKTLKRTVIKIYDFLNLNYTFTETHAFVEWIIILGSLGLLAFILFGLFKFAFEIFTKKLSGRKKLVSLSYVIVYVLLVLVLITIIGSPSHRKFARYYIFLCVLFSVFAVYLFRLLKFPPKLIAIFSIFVFLGNISVARENKLHESTSNWAISYHISRKYLEGLNLENCQIIARFPEQYIVHGWSATGFRYANSEYSKLLADLKQQKIKNIYIIQRISARSGNVYSRFKLVKNYKLQTVFKESKDRYSNILISRVSNFD